MSTEGGDKFNDMVAKLNFVKDGAVKLPPGFRFQPTDQEIVFQYLIRKTISCPLPAMIIPEFINISKYNPHDLPGDWEQDRYFFSKNVDDRMYGNGNRNNGGYWKGKGVDKQISPAIVRCCGNYSNSRRREIAIMGMKKTLVFFKAGRRTRWIMHEYRLLHSLNPSNHQKSWVQMGDWVLCHVLFLKKRERKSQDHETRILEEAFEDNKAKTTVVLTTQHKRLSDSISSDDSTSSSSSVSDSSVITEVSSSRSSGIIRS